MSAAALIVALASAGSAGWLWWQQTRGHGEQTDLATAQARELAGLEARVDEIARALAGMDDLGAAVNATTAQLGQQLTELRSELAGIRAQLQQGLDRGGQHGRGTLVLNEAESLMRIAGFKLQLQRDAPAARDALALADERLARLGEPRVVPVRETLAREMQALGGVAAPDVAGAAARLSALSAQSSTLALRRADTPEATDAPAEEASQDTGWSALVASVGQSLSRLVRVQRHDDSTTLLLLTPDEERLLRENLRLKFETARLAMLQHRATVYHEALTEAGDWLKAYFDEHDAAVNQAQEQTGALLALELAPALPDISGSLRQLRALRDETQAETGQ